MTVAACSCFKDSFRSHRDAQKAIDAVRRRVKKRKSGPAGGGQPSVLSVYRCPEGAGYHIGGGTKRPR